MGLYDSSVGSFVIGTILNVFLLGITSAQCWTYFSSFPNDKRVYWWLVVFLCALDWAHSAISCYTIYYWCVTEYGNAAILARSPWSFTIEPAMTGVASICSQSFYAWRVYVVSKRPPWIPCVTMFLSLVALGFSVGATGQIYHLDSQFALFSTWRYGVSTWLASAAAADVLITGALVYYLHKSGSTFVITSSIVDKIISNVISTNGLTACVALGDTILFAALDTSEHVIPQLCLVKLYFNSLLVSLNARVELERQLANGGGMSSGGGQVSLTTPLGFGASDVRPSFWKRSSNRKKGMSTGRTDFASQIHVETLRTNHADTFVEFGDMNHVRSIPGADEEKARHVAF